ncbi:MAG TPA: DUF5668 domain-containing protein [Bryobacteraceae bacterium]|jgi:hypothetical protein|nr:DUF5668 domain-containing protein [Bryobacteraceae bacterium]
MNCENHPEVAATAYCRTCGKPVCTECRRDAFGTVFCAEHVPQPEPAAGPPPAAAPTPGFQPSARSPYPYPEISPGLAFFLGWIPGVGAIYNGQYAKGLVHAVIWGILVTITNSNAVHGMEPIFGILICAWMFYMAFEAYHTALKRRAGEPVDEYSSIIELRGHNAPAAGVTLVLLGVVMLLYTLDLFDFERVIRYWPVLLIAGGVYLLYGRFAGGAAHEEARHERR